MFNADTTSPPPTATTAKKSQKFHLDPDRPHRRSDGQLLADGLKGAGTAKGRSRCSNFSKMRKSFKFLFFFCFCLFLSRLKLEGGDICVASSFENQTLLKVELNGLSAGAAAASSSTSSSSPKKERDPIAEFFENISIRIAGETKYCKPSQTNHLLKAVLSDCMAQR